MADGALASPKKGADQEGRTIVWVDESAFYLLPGVVRTYAPRGQTPVLRLPLTRDHLSVISGITPAGQLLMLVQERPYKSPDIVRFLKHLLRHIPVKLLVIWDGAPIHRGHRSKTSWPRWIPAHPAGAVPRLRPRTEPGRGHLELPQTRRTPKPLLPEPPPTPTAPAPRGFLLTWSVAGGKAPALAAWLVGGGWQREVDRRALIHDAVCPDLPAQCLDHMLGDGEPQARPDGRPRLVHLVEPLEDARQVILRDARASVGHGEVREPAIWHHADLDLAAGRGELDGVVDECQQDVLHAGTVGQDRGQVV